MERFQTFGNWQCYSYTKEGRPGSTEKLQINQHYIRSWKINGIYDT